MIEIVPDVSIWAHIKKERNIMNQDHFLTLLTPKRVMDRLKILKKVCEPPQVEIPQTELAMRASYGLGKGPLRGGRGSRRSF